MTDTPPTRPTPPDPHNPPKAASSVPHRKGVSLFSRTVLKNSQFGNLLLPMATQQERNLRRWIYVGPIVALSTVVATLGGVTTGWLSPKVFMGLPLVWVGLIGSLLVITKLAAANYLGLQHLRKIGYRICPACEYDLAGVQESEPCPECGDHSTPDERRERWEEIYRIHTLQKTFGSGRKPPGPPR